MKSLPHASRGWWGASVGGVGEDRVLYVTQVDLEVVTPEIELGVSVPQITLEVIVPEVELEDE